MMMCDMLIVIDPKQPDQNSLDELAAALVCMGATVLEIDRTSHVIEAIVPATQVPTLHHLGGVSYIRPVFSYHCPPPQAA